MLLVEGEPSFARENQLELWSFSHSMQLKCDTKLGSAVQMMQCGFKAMFEMPAGHNRCSQLVLFNYCLFVSTWEWWLLWWSPGKLLGLQRMRDALDNIKWHLEDSKSCFGSSCRRFTYSAYPVAHGNLLVSFRMRMGRAMWSAEHSISSGESPRNWGLIYGNFIGSSVPGLPPPPELLPAMIPPMNPATADLTRVSMLVARRGGASVGRCAAPRLPFPGLPPSSAALVDDRLGGEQEAAAEEQEEEGTLRWLTLHSFREDTTAAAGGEDDENGNDAFSKILHTPMESLITARPSWTRKYTED